MLGLKAGTFIYIHLTVSIARMLAASMQCWRMVRALRSHGRRDLLTRCPRTPLVLELPLWLTASVDHWLVNRAVRPERSLRLLSSRKYTSVESLATQTAGPLKRPSPSTYASLHDITDSFTSCYKSQRLQTRLRLLHYVVLLTRLQYVVRSSSITL